MAKKDKNAAEVQQPIGNDTIPTAAGKDTLHVKVYSPYQVYYDDIATSVSAENDTGPFDILAQHHNFMTLVNACEVIIRNKGTDDKRIRITRGVMHVRSDKVTLFLDV